jgi:chromate reductase, NAD(P)H dehydrogenase (quinone)
VTIVADAQLDVLVICGSLRKGSYNAALARALPALAPSGMTLRAAPSFAGLPAYNFDEHETGGIHPIAAAWIEAVRSADALIIVSPEYNWSIPGGLKNAIDWASRLKDVPFAGKPVALQSAATGHLGGSRMQYHLRQSLTSIDALIFGKPEVIITFAAKKFDEKTLELTDGPTRDAVKLQLAGFEKFVRRVATRGS